MRALFRHTVAALVAGVLLLLGPGCDSRNSEQPTAPAGQAWLVKTPAPERRSLARALTNTPGVWGVQEYPPEFIVFQALGPLNANVSRKLGDVAVWGDPAAVAASREVELPMKVIFARLSTPAAKSIPQASPPLRMPTGPDALAPGHVLPSPAFAPKQYAAISPESRTSEFFLGTIAIALLLPESNGSAEPSTENWTEGEVALVQARIAEGLLYAQGACPGCRIGFVVHTLSYPANGGVTGTVDTDYEAIAHDFNDIQVNDNILSKINPAYATGDTVAGFRLLANDVRNQYETDWAVVVKVGRDVSAGGRNWGASPLFAVAYLGGPFMALTYKNAGWGENYLGDTFAHELNHSFYALDEYEAAGVSALETAGYYNVANAGTAFNDGLGPIAGAGEAGPDCMMTYGWGGPPYRYCAHTQGQIGWWDDDGDGLPNPFDAPPVTQLASLECAAGAMSATGAAWVNQNSLYSDKPRYHGGSHVSGLGVIDSVEYRINRLTWLAATPADGAWDEGYETFSLSHGLPNGDYALDVRARDSFGNTSTLTARALCTVAASSITDAVPFARFEAPELGKPNVPLVFDALETSDLEDPAYALSFRWDWEGDGIFDTAWSTQSRISHMYPSAGTYDVRMAVRDRAGNVRETSRRVEVVNSNQPPHLVLAIDSTFKGGTPAPVFSVSVSRSTDLEGEPLAVRYDFENDGTWDTPWLARLVTDITYVIPDGKSHAWTLAVQLRDESGGLTAGYANLRAVAYNHPPVAQFTSAYLGNATFRFDATGTYDPDGATSWDGFLEYRWDFDGDGQFDTHYTTNPVAQFTYRGPGTYTPVLEARDRFRLRAVVRKKFTLLGAVPENLMADLAGRPYTPRLSWSAVAGSPGYAIQIATDPDFQDIYAAFRSQANSSDAPVLFPATTYYWRVSAVTPYYEEVGYSSAASFKTITGPPAARALSIWPAGPQTADDLEARYEFISGGLPESESILTWYLDGAEVPSLRGHRVVPAAMTRKGQAWYFSFEPRDAFSTGATQTSEAVTIHNTAPSIALATVIALGQGEYRCEPAGWQDADGDPAAYLIRWWHDDREIGHQETTQVSGGRWLLCEIRPFDGESEGAPVKSEPLGIGMSSGRKGDSGGCAAVRGRPLPIELILLAMGWAIRRRTD